MSVLAERGLLLLAFEVSDNPNEEPVPGDHYRHPLHIDSITNKLRTFGIEVEVTRTFVGYTRDDDPVPYALVGANRKVIVAL